MQNIGYIRWAYIPVDSDPKNNEITTWNPPVLTNMALDDGASLVIDLSYSLTYINIFIQTTAFSKPVDPDLSLNIFLTDVNNSFVIVDQYIDRTYLRQNSFFEKGFVAHVSMADPTCKIMNKVIFNFYYL